MMDSRSRSDILLQEKIAKVDDINFDKIYDIDEFATKQINKFNTVEDSVINIDSIREEVSKPIFEIEIFPNEFLDNHVFEKEDKVVQKSKFSLSNKPLFFAFTSIAILLCILFIYNVFVINSLENSAAKTLNVASVTAVVDSGENDFISFENSSSIKIETANTTPSASGELAKASNWFDIFCNYISRIFGG